jgi:hypothetical protein
MQSKSKPSALTQQKPKDLLTWLLRRIHGSGTPFGDALELEGFNLAMEELGNEDHRFVIGSTKGNIGNTQVSKRQLIG